MDVAVLASAGGKCRGSKRCRDLKAQVTSKVGPYGVTCLVMSCKASSTKNKNKLSKTRVFMLRHNSGNFDVLFLFFTPALRQRLAC